jgi:hypothetical protein
MNHYLKAKAGQDAAASAPDKGYELGAVGRRRLIVGGVVAAGLMLTAAGLVVAAGIARADVDGAVYGGGSMGDRDAYSFWNQLDEYSHVTVATAQDVATTTCRMRADGQSEGRVVNAMAAVGIDSDVARLAVHGAEFHFCPTYYNY